MEERLAVVVSSTEELIGKLTQYCTQSDADQRDANQSDADQRDADQSDADIDGLYVGSRQAQLRAQLLIDGEEGEEFIKRLIDGRKLTKLAQLWVMGLEIEWNLLHAAAHPARKPKRISIPPYPFARERYWIPQEASSRVQYRKAKGLHPLIDRIILRLSLESGGLVFQKILHATDLIIRDHQVRGKRILPGAGYVEMAYAALSQINNNYGDNLSAKSRLWLYPFPNGLVAAFGYSGRSKGCANCYQTGRRAASIHT